MTRLALCLALLAAPMAAPARSGPWQVPEGCEIFLTVQSRGCRVSNHYRCAADAQGDQWRADFDQEGLFFLSRINFETEWVESYETNPPTRQTLDPAPEDPASFTELVTTGHDSYRFALSRDDGRRSHVVGSDRLTGRTFTVSGVTLEETEYEFTETDTMGNVLRREHGNESISREMRLFFAGAGETDLGDGTWLPFDGSPVTLAFPGQPGFGSTRPLYECDALTADAGGEITRISAPLASAGRGMARDTAMPPGQPVTRP